MSLEERIVALSVDLLPCPFCGQRPAMAVPLICLPGDPEPCVEVWCVGIDPHGDEDIHDCRVAPCVFATTPEGAAALWNNRGTPPIVPKMIETDNGRAFASKTLTGGADTNYRFKIRDEDKQ